MNDQSLFKAKTTRVSSDGRPPLRELFVLVSFAPFSSLTGREGDFLADTVALARGTLQGEDPDIDPLYPSRIKGLRGFTTPLRLIVNVRGILLSTRFFFVDSEGAPPRLHTRFPRNPL